MHQAALLHASVDNNPEAAAEAIVHMQLTWQGRVPAAQCASMRQHGIHCLTLTATTSPASQQASAAPFSDSCALCTCPMLPQAMGTSSIQSNSWSGGSANELCRALQVYLRNMTT
jgi:hypothetical protein